MVTSSCASPTPASKPSTGAPDFGRPVPCTRPAFELERGKGGRFPRHADSLREKGRQAVMQVHEILAAKGATVITAEPDCPLSVAARALAERNIGALVVMDEHDRLIGILSERDIVRAFALGGVTALGGEVQDLMSREVITCALDD